MPSPQFYAFLAKLIDEYDALTASGWRGDGFHSEGIRIGVGHSHDVPIHLAREKAILAAEERSRVQKLMSGSGRALGGSGAAVRTGKSPRELAAEVLSLILKPQRLPSDCHYYPPSQAAERRLRDDRTCGLDQAKEAAKASRDGVIEINEDDDDDDAAAVTPVTLASSVPASGEAAASDDEIEIVEPPSTRPPLVADPSNLAAGEPLSRGTVLNRAQGPRPMAQTKPFAPVAPRGYPPALIATPVEPSAPVDVWPCPACTYHNALQASTCAICDGSRPVLSASQKAIFNRIGWTCTSCGQTEIGTEWWTCVTAGCPGVRGWS